MKKRAEIANPMSCFNRARDDEWLFVLLARDVAAPATIRFWCEERIRLGKNVWADAQIRQALHCAAHMTPNEPDPAQLILREETP